MNAFPCVKNMNRFSVPHARIQKFGKLITAAATP